MPVKDRFQFPNRAMQEDVTPKTSYMVEGIPFPTKGAAIDRVFVERILAALRKDPLLAPREGHFVSADVVYFLLEYHEEIQLLLAEYGNTLRAGA